MEKTHQRIVITKWFSVLLAVFFLGCMIFGHRIAVTWLSNTAHVRGESLGPIRLPVLLVLGYGCGLLAEYLLYRMIRFLSNMEKGIFYSQENVRHLRTVSAVFLILAAVFTIAAVLYSVLFLALTIAAVFLSLIVSICAAIFEQAESMKDELDLTI